MQQRGCRRERGRERDDDGGGLLKSSQIYQRCSDSSCLCFLVFSSPVPLLPSLLLRFLTQSGISSVPVYCTCRYILSLLSGLAINADCLQLASLTYNIINIYVTLPSGLLSTSALSLSSVAISIACLSNLHAALPQPQRIPERTNYVRQKSIKIDTATRRGFLVRKLFLRERRLSV